MRREERDRQFEELVVAVWPRLRRAAYLLCHDSHEADDLVQTVLTRCYARWGRRTAPGDAYAYLRRSLVNAYIDSTRRWRPQPMDVHEGEPGTASPDHSVEDRSELTELLAPLSPRERSILVLRYYFDTPEVEVAQRLGVSTGTVKSTASRALARLRSSATLTEGEN